jgi:hypothetical protein
MKKEEFKTVVRLGEIENLPVGDNQVDKIIEH